MAIYKNTAPIVTNGLVVYLDVSNTLSYISGSNTITNLTNPSYTGSLINNPTFSRDAGGSLVFNGSSTVISGSVPPLVSTLGHTFVVWVKLNSLSSEQHFIGLKATPSTQFYSFGNRLGTAAYGDVRGYENRFKTGSWYMITQTRTSTDSGSHYVNGELVATGSLPSYGTGSEYVVGNFPGGGGYYLNGSIAMGFIYNRTLSQAEILQNYNATKTRFGLT